MTTKILPLFLVLVLITSCSSTKKTYSVKPSSKKTPVATKRTNNTSAANTKLLKTFKKYEGTPYKFGGNTTKGIDCSGFVCAVYKEVYKKQIPRTTTLLKKYGTKVALNKLKPGDLVFYRPNNTYNHVGVYIGNGYVAHSTSSKGVIKTKLSNSYWKKYYVFSRRVNI